MNCFKCGGSGVYYGIGSVKQECKVCLGVGHVAVEQESKGVAVDDKPVGESKVKKVSKKAVASSEKEQKILPTGLNYSSEKRKKLYRKSV